MHEGDKVTYVGPGNEYIAPGTEGRILMLASATSAHLQVTSGAVLLVETDDLAPLGRTASRDILADSLEVGGLSTFAVRQTFDEEGETGVLNAMASLGHLAAFVEIAEEAIVLVSSRIRTDPSFREVLAHLDEEEGEAVLRLASACLIRDAFDGEE